MKYTHNDRVRLILTLTGKLGFDTYQEAESAIILNEDWSTRWDCSDLLLDDLTYVNNWRQEQWDKHGSEYQSAIILARYVKVKNYKSNINH